MRTWPRFASTAIGSSRGIQTVGPPSAGALITSEADALRLTRQEIETWHAADTNDVATALLHDTIEDTKASYGEVSDIFGRDIADLVDGVTKRRPFHSYTMKQAIQEGFILDVLANYVAVDAYYKLVKVVEDDPEFDARRANKKLRAFVEGQREAIRQKAEVMADHFHEQVWAKKKIGGKARAMIVTSSIDRAISPSTSGSSSACAVR